MLLSTTSSLDDKIIKEYRGIVFGEEGQVMIMVLATGTAVVISRRNY